MKIGVYSCESRLSSKGPLEPLERQQVSAAVIRAPAAGPLSDGFVTISKTFLLILPLSSGGLQPGRFGVLPRGIRGAAQLLVFVR